MSEQSVTTPTPARIHDFAWGLGRTATLVTALDLDVFTAIAEGNDTLEDLGRRTGASRRGLHALLTALHASEFVHREGDRYRLADDVATYLVRGSRAYLGDMRHIHRELNYRIWPQLTEAVRSGIPCKEIFADRADDVWGKITPYLDALGVGAGRWIAGAVEGLVRPRPRILDVGCGYGGTGRALTESWGGTVVGIDREISVSEARRLARDAGLGDRAEYRSGDLFTEPWGGPYDVVLLGNLLHGYPPAQVREILRLSAAALADDGVLLLYEIVPDDTETDPVGAFFSLQMLMTSEGSAHSLDDYGQWLAEAGLPVRRQLRSPTGPGTLVAATRGAVS
ncbi:class I SAM-dependent methyltransferase [Streptomyces lomondensis]|uniref:O-methyltransferase n=1 Tax=Streptomyces lomondensis TaxID=68229 RepID=A0ABQ2X074_9ACTN|nr:class I SAM-dependent methyltransferase [Streptomyces lomondensis]MCF0076141.1 methyltransferase domain-containing protein [Streptomyces lomondensis]GGW88626.1 O-methyltransferase [Streptomyces lomondensis]